MANFLRISPWQAGEVRAALRAHQVAWLIIRQHRDEHAIDWLQGAIKMAIGIGDPELVLQRFLRLEA